MEKLASWRNLNLSPRATRNVIAVGFLVISIGCEAAAMLLAARGSGPDPAAVAKTPAGQVVIDLLINLGTEIFGILVTLAVVDIFLEPATLQERGRELAWAALHGVERVVWVWQGGPRRLGTDELLGLISSINPGDSLQPFTRNLLISLGNRGREILEIESAAARTVPGLDKVAADLASLRALGERGSAAVTLRMVIEVLEGATVELARILGQPTQKMPAGLVRNRDASPEGQAGRYNYEAGSFDEVREGGARGGTGVVHR
jgi:hypothetical protein